MLANTAKKYVNKEFIPTHTRVSAIACPQSWSQLEKKEKMYAYHMARASWEGSKICWFQRSYESPALFVLLQLLYSQDMSQLKERCLGNGVTEEEWS
jgi:dipeptidyl-peptidase-3